MVMKMLTLLLSLYLTTCIYTKILNSNFSSSVSPLLPVSTKMESGNLTSLFFIVIKYAYKICKIYMVYPQNSHKLSDKTNLSLIWSPLIFLNPQICIVLCANIRKVLIASFSFYIYMINLHNMLQYSVWFNWQILYFEVKSMYTFKLHAK